MSPRHLAKRTGGRRRAGGPSVTDPVDSTVGGTRIATAPSRALGGHARRNASHAARSPSETDPVMTTTRRRTSVVRAALVALVALGLTAVAAPAQAKPPLVPQKPDSYTLAAGQGCDFTLKVTGTGARTVTKVKGNVTIVSGIGHRTTVKNADTGKAKTFPAGLITTTTVTRPDGSQHVTALGPNLLSLFPTDVPPGPSTTLYLGRVTYTIGPAPDLVWTLRSSAGPSLDVCALLS